MEWKNGPFEVLKGKKIVKAYIGVGETENHKLTIEDSEGNSYLFIVEGDCCSQSWFQQIVGDANKGEVMTYFPEAAEKVFEVTEKLQGWRARMNCVWTFAQAEKSQKDFAIYVNKHLPKLSSILFNARKFNRKPDEIFLESEDLLVKLF